MIFEKSVEVSSPCNFTLFGYDIAFYNGTSVGISLDKRVKCQSELEKRFTVNGEDLDSKKHPLIRAAIIHGWSDIDTPVSLEIDPLLHPDNAVGYDPANVITALSALSMLHDRLIFDDIAKKGHVVLSGVFDDVGPLGTSTSIHGSGVISSKKIRDNWLWSIESGNRTCNMHHLDIPDMTFVLAFPGGEANSGRSIQNNILKMIQRQKSFATDIFKEAAVLAEKGILAVRDGDVETIGALMNGTDKLSAILGMYDERLKNLTNVCKRNSYGVKVSCAVKEGCIVALTDEPDEVVKSIEKAGGVALITHTSKRGIEV